MNGNFSDLKKYVIRLGEIVRNPEIVYAHTRKINENPDNDLDKTPELLEEHINRCLYYFEQLYGEKNLHDIFGRFSVELLGKMSSAGSALFEEMLINTISFHDMGKINPAFQKKLGNIRFNMREVSCLDGSNHALLSAAVFIDYFSEQIRLYCTEKRIDKNEMEKLHVIMLADAYVISRHHVDLTPFSSFLNEFIDGGKLQYIFEGVKNNEFTKIYCGPFYQGTPELVNLGRKNMKCLENFYQDKSNELSLYTYIRLLFSLLVSCDYYATTEYENNMKIRDFGNISDINELNDVYEQSSLLQEIRKFSPKDFEDDGKDINVLRKCMFYEAEETLKEHGENGIYFIEAPTGGGKSNIAMNCSFKLLDESIRKIFYVYPFNTLVEQNIDSLEKIFGNSEFYSNIAVVNSITPIKTTINENKRFVDNISDEENTKFYQQALLDRQFLNYPFILTTHVNLFQVMFGSERESAISFYQLSGSVIVLDEIQSYRNTIWTEIMMFLENYSRLLNIRIIIMSATLPRLDDLTGNQENVVNLIQDRRRYFEDDRFKSRVKVSYELFDENGSTDEEDLYLHICDHAGKGKKVLVEFIKKKRAEDFYRRMKEQEREEFVVLCMTGDDNMIDRKRIMKQITSEKSEKGIVLIATQVVEAGVDIDMDIGYKDISKLDSDEQFLGRINRNFKRSGITYFFNMDDAKGIYGQDYRVNKELTLSEHAMREILEKKDFHSYYANVLNLLKSGRNQRMNENGIEYFVENEVKVLDFSAVAKRMQLINEDQWDMSVFLARIIEDEEGNILNGKEIWDDYKELLLNQTMGYAQKQILLSEVRSRMNYFIYRIRKNSDLIYSDRVGELYCIEDGEKYFENGRLNKEYFESKGAKFIEI